MTQFSAPTGTEAINGITELHGRIARGFRNPANYRLRMILAAGRLTLWGFITSLPGGPAARPD